MANVELDVSNETPDFWSGTLTVAPGKTATVIARAHSTAGGNHNKTGVRLTILNQDSGAQRSVQDFNPSENASCKFDDVKEGRYSVEAASWNEIAAAAWCRVSAQAN